MDFSKITPDYVLAVAAVVLAMSVGYWLAVIKDDKKGTIHYQQKRRQEK